VKAKGVPEVIPPSVIRRLTKYLAFVQGLRAAGVEWVSSRDLAQILGMTSSTVRQDLSHIDFCGISKKGYATEGLQKVLAAVLGADTTWRMVVVGAGNLGRALALHEDFSRRGFIISGVFDSDRQKIGKKIGRHVIRHVRELPSFLGRKGADIGIIAVPAPAAQGVADLLIASGVRGLLNMALTHIVVPREVPVIETRIVASVMELSHAIRVASR
jgi:redox-sensing transcriptional repressor